MAYCYNEYKIENSKDYKKPNKIFYCNGTKSFDKIYTVHPALSSPFCVFVQD